MNRTSLFSLIALSLLAICSAAPNVNAQSIYDININTSGLSSMGGGLAFDFVAGDNATPNNTVLITGFSTNSALAAGSNVNTGAASGSLPGTLTLQDSGFSESFRGITFGT